MSARVWEDVPIEKLDRAEWEALCDGCGKCCIHKLEDDETGALVATNVACRLLDRTSGQCSNYRHRHAFVSECVRLTMANVRAIDWPRSEERRGGKEGVRSLRSWGAAYN